MKYDHKSTTIKSSNYSPTTRTATVEFHSGGSYEYYDVPIGVYSEFIRSKSSGRFFHQNIKDTYKYKKL